MSHIEIPLDAGISVMVSRSATGDVVFDMEHPVFMFIKAIRMQPAQAVALAHALTVNASQATEGHKGYSIDVTKLRGVRPDKPEGDPVPCRCAVGMASASLEGDQVIYCHEPCKAMASESNASVSGHRGPGNPGGQGEGSGAALPVCDSGCEMRCEVMGKQPGRACWLEGA